MDTAPSQLVVRQHERHTCSLPAHGGVDIAQTEQVNLAVQIAGGASGDFACTLTDVSHGGLGLRTAVFVPKTTRVQLRVALADGGPPVEIALRVMRVAMVDRTPTFYLGTSFVQPQSAIAAALTRLIVAAQSQAGTTATAAGGPTRA